MKQMNQENGTAGQGWLLAGLSLSILMASLDTSIANVALPALAAAFSASFPQVQWVVLSYLLAITTLIVSAGRLGDLLGRRRLLLAGIALFTIASALCGLAPSLPMLIAARALQGLAAAVMIALTMAFVAEAVPAGRTGGAMGLVGTMSAAGTALGPTLGGLLIGLAGWRAIFLVNVPIGAVAFLLAQRFLPADRPGVRRERFDFAGTLLLAIALGSYAMAMTSDGAFGRTRAGLLFVALAAAALFALVQARSTSPLVRLALLREPGRGAAFAMSALVTTVVMATLVVGPFYLSGALLLEAARVGLVMSCGPIVAALTGIPAGRIVDRFGTGRSTLAGLLAMAVGSSLLALLPLRSGVAGYVVPLALLTAGYALFQAANNTAVMSGVAAAQRGVVSGLLNLSRNLGLITGASLMGAVFAAGSEGAAGTVAIAAGMHRTFLLATVFIVTAVAIASVAGKGWAGAASVIARGRGSEA